MKVDAHAEATIINLAELRANLRQLSAGCRMFEGERDILLRGLLAQLHQCFRRLAEGRQPLPSTAELARRFYRRLHAFWVEDCHAISPEVGLVAQWVAWRLLDDGHEFMSECGGAPLARIDPHLTAAFSSDLVALQQLAHADWRSWLAPVGIVQREPRPRGPEPATRGNPQDKSLFDRLVGSRSWLELVGEIADYRFTHGRPKQDPTPVYRLSSNGKEALEPIGHFAEFPLEWLQGNEARVEVVERNTQRLLEGQPANNVLIWGPRGCGKSSLIRGLIGKYHDRGLRGVEIGPDSYERIPDLFSRVRSRRHCYLGVLDNISMSSGDPAVHTLARVLDGCLEEKPDNLVFYATSNYKDLVDRAGERVEGLGNLQMEMTDEQQVRVNRGMQPEFYDPQQQQRLDEQRALDDRFALKVFMDLPTREVYEQMVLSYARRADVAMEDEELLQAFSVWRMRHNHDLVGGRTARDFAIDMAPSRSDSSASSRGRGGDRR